ncbi:MAG: zinc ABC transporter solute-binding protein [Methanomicrobiales archaeon]|nr:zinc ABC transporter solute-binding protein [Methanomicrobiales archaeon]
MITFLVAAGLIIICTAAGCIQHQETKGISGNATSDLTVVVSILPQKQIAERIAGDRAKVIVIVPPGASPHTYEPTPGQLAEISSADVYVTVGSGIEFERAWMDKIANLNPSMMVVNSSKGIEFLESQGDEEEEDGHASGGETGTDPHVWLSLRNARIMAENTCQGLAAADPSHAAEYRANTDSFIRELDELDASITRDVAARNISTFMVYHPAWSYFARDYHLVQIPIEAEGKEPTATGVRNLIRQAREKDIRVIFAAPEYSTKSAEVIAGEIGGRVVLVSPLEEDYLRNMKNAASAFMEGSR